MPKGYLILTEAVHDAAGMREYGTRAAPSIAAAGASVLVVDGNPEVLEGDWHGNQTVVLEFESVEAAKAWYDSADYRAALPLRQAAADCNAVIVAGFEPPRDRS